MPKTEKVSFIDMSKELMQEMPICIKFKNGSISSFNDIWPVADLAGTNFAGHARDTSGSDEHPRTTHYVALPLKSDQGNIEVARFDGKVTKITTNEAPFVYEKCNSCGGTPPSAQGHDSAVSCPHCSQTIVGKQITSKFMDQEVLLLKPEFHPIEPYYHNVDKQDVLEKQAEIEAENNRQGIGCASWLALLTTLTAGTIAGHQFLADAVSKLSDITFAYNHTDYYIPTSLLKDGISTANLICLAPLILAGLATILRYRFRMKDPVYTEIILETLRNLPDEINDVHIYQLSNEQYRDPTIMVHIREK